MNDERKACIGLRAAFAAFALANAFALAAPAAGDPEIDIAARGRGSLVARYEEITACSKSQYWGVETILYSDRPYHTRERVAPLVGRAFCRGARHGTSVWIVEIVKATTLTAFGTEDCGLGERGWTKSDEPLLVEASGVSLDRIYTKEFQPGRYVIRQGFSRVAPLVFWDEEAVRLAP